jgi:hypothetical protein
MHPGAFFLDHHVAVADTHTTGFAISIRQLRRCVCQGVLNRRAKREGLVSGVSFRHAAQPSGFLELRFPLGFQRGLALATVPSPLD